MARTTIESGVKTADQPQDNLTFQADGANKIELPSSDFIADAAMTREGNDLILETPNGETAVIEGYFSAVSAPILSSPEGGMLTPNLVQAFVHSPMEYAANETASDQSPIGAVEEVKGNATVTRADGTVETIAIGTPIYQGDVVETDATGAVNIVFMDETSMAVSENARLAIDEYSYDPATESGTTNFSVLRGLFVFTSGLIGRDDPDDVKIDTPVGSIGIRGTIIAGEINPNGESNITVLEGAIVVTNGEGEVTLSQQFETVKLGGFNDAMQEMGVVPASDINTRFSSVSGVNASLFSMISEAVQEQSVSQPTPAPEAPAVDVPMQQMNEAPAESAPQSSAPVSENTQTANVDGTVSAEPVADLAPVLGAEIINLVDNQTGLPSTEAVLGQPSTGIFNTDPAGTAGTAPANQTTLPPLSTATTGSASTTPANNAPLTAADAPTSPTAIENSSNTGGTTVTAPSRVINLDADGNGVSRITDNIGNSIGFSINALGDVNGDGFDDFVFSNSTTVTGQNHVYRVLGNNAGIPSGTVVGLDAAAGNPLDVVANATPINNFAETIVAGIGDFDGDGQQDYILGQNANGASGSGVALIQSGDSADAYTLTSGGADQIGYSVNGVGDFNNDGYDDVLVGAPAGNDAYFIRGGLNPWSSPLSQTLSGAGSSLFGNSVSGIGDFNGDGYQDFAVGAHGNAGGLGLVNIYLGNQAGTATAPLVINGTTGEGLGVEVAGIGDVNGDGRSDMFVAGTGSVAKIFFGGDIVSDITIDTGGLTITGGGSAGDFNGDGYDDFTIALEDSVNNETSTYVVFGKSGMPGTIDLAYLQNAGNAFELQYSAEPGSLEVQSIGDINGDGFDDIAIGDYSADSGNGQVIIVNGRGTNAANAVVGTSGNNTLTDGGAAGMSVRGGAGNDVINITNTNFLGIDGGNGSDTLRSGSNLDFSGLNFEKISGIEVLQYGAAAGQTMTLTMENIFNLLKTSDTGTLHISTDTVGQLLNIDGATPNPGTSANIITEFAGISGGTAVDNSSEAGYMGFDIGGYTLYIDSQLAVNVV